MDLRRHELGQESLGSALADLRFEIQRAERVKDVAGQKGGQQEALDSVGIVFVDVVGMPAVCQFVEPVIFDIPSLVAEGDGPSGGDEMERKRSHPDPVAGEPIVFAVELPFHGMCFERTDDSHRSIDLGPGKQIRKIPPGTLAVLEGTRLRRDAGEQTGRILKQIAPFILENGQRVFAASQKKVEKRRGGVKRVGQIRGCGRRSTTPLMTVTENWKTFSE